jgi:N-methylhydantoinase A/oxoprolinase/acetone carboxylase beta subunit
MEGKFMSDHTKLTRIELCYADTGGTFTDVFLVDSDGNFIIGKSPSTPDDLSRGYFSAIEQAAQKIGQSLGELCSQASIVGYGMTVAVNTILTRTGAKVGALVNKGFEQVMLLGRGKQTWLGYDIYDIIHARTHRREDPLVPCSLTKGITERVNSLGHVVIPLYEHEVREAAWELINNGVEAIAICFLWSFINPSHEKRAQQIVYEVSKEIGKTVPVCISSEVCPVYRELLRANTTVVEAYVTTKVKEGVGNIQSKLKDYGYKGSLQIMQATGGMTSIETLKMVETINSGPIGGLMGGVYIGQLYGFDNLVTTDVGGTSFDVGLVTNGVIARRRESSVGRMLLGVPAPEMNSIGAGGGTYVFLDSKTKRMQVGPGSAGAVPGPVCYDKGGEIPTITDCDLILGYIAPDYFLGGTSGITINKEKALHALKEKLADPLGLDVADVALGARDLLDSRMRDTIVGMVMSRGYSLSEYYLLSFGGAGPTHCAGYTDGLLLKGVMLFPYSSTFCAFGASTSDYQHNYVRAMNIVIPSLNDSKSIKTACDQLNKGWQSLENIAYTQMEQEGFQKGKIKFKHLGMIRYGRQLDDIAVTSPKPRLENITDWENLIDVFENMYGKIYAAGAKYPQSGYEIFEIGLEATVEKIKPILKQYQITNEKPSKQALKGERRCYFKGKWEDTEIYNWERLEAGNTIRGPAIIESATTNLVLPPQKSIYIDKYLTVWLK